MDNNEIVDISTRNGYNEANDINDMVVKMDEQAPIHDTDCKHENLVADSLDTIGDSVYHGCANYKCGVGFYIQPTK